MSETHKSCAQLVSGELGGPDRYCTQVVHAQNQHRQSHRVLASLSCTPTWFILHQGYTQAVRTAWNLSFFLGYDNHMHLQGLRLRAALRARGRDAHIPWFVAASRELNSPQSGTLTLQAGHRSKALPCLQESAHSSSRAPTSAPAHTTSTAAPQTKPGPLDSNTSLEENTEFWPIASNNERIRGSEILATSHG